MAEGHGELAALPRRARKETIQETALLFGGLLLKQFSGAAGQFEDADAFFHVALIRVLMILNTLEHRALLAAKGLAVEERGVDVSVELIFVEHVKPVLDALLVRLKFGDRFVVKTPFVSVAGAERFGDPREDFLVEREVLQGAGERRFQLFFADVRFRALAFEAGAMVVDVAAFLEFAHQGAAQWPQDTRLEKAKSWETFFSRLARRRSSTP